MDRFDARDSGLIISPLTTGDCAAAAARAAAVGPHAIGTAASPTAPCKTIPPTIPGSAPTRERPKVPTGVAKAFVPADR